MPNFQQKIRRIWITFIGVIFVFFIFKLVSPFGTWTCSRNFNETGRNFLNRSCLGEPSPGERVAKGSAGPLLILADPVYLSVFTPRAFSRAEVTITYRPYLSSSTPIFEAGFLADQLGNSAAFSLLGLLGVIVSLYLLAKSKKHINLNRELQN